MTSSSVEVVTLVANTYDARLSLTVNGANQRDREGTWLLLA